MGFILYLFVVKLHREKRNLPTETVCAKNRQNREMRCC